MFNFNIREKILWILLTFGFFLVISTEILSYFNLLERKIIISLWLLIFLNCFFFYLKIYLKKNFSYSENNFSIKKFDLLFLVPIIIIISLTFIISLLYPPNTPDSLSYHMPRVMQWIQNQNIDFFPTSDTRQLYLGPFSEFVIMHLMFLTNNDFLSNLVQWFSLVFCITNISLIVKKLGGNLSSQLTSSLFCATIPMGILQSTGTQTDYVVSMWITSLVYFLVSYLKENKIIYIYGFAASLSLAILTKQTAYICSLPFCIWLCAYILKSNPKHFKHILLMPLIILILNLGHFMRTYKTFGSPINSDNLSVRNEIINLQSVSSNIIRNISLNMTVPSHKINKITRDIVEITHSLLKIDIEDKRTTFSVSPKTDSSSSGIAKYYVYFSLKENLASNTLHFLILILCFAFFLLKKKFYQRKTLYYLISIIACFMFFSAVLKWQPFGNRLLLPFFILSSPFIGLVLARFENKFFLITVPLILFLYSLPYLLMNDTRPLISKVVKEKNYDVSFVKPYFKVKNRQELYSVSLGKPKYDEPIIQLSKFIKEIGCKSVGFISFFNSYEYLFWVFLKEDSLSKTKIYYLDVTNKSSKNYNKFKEIEVCAIIKNYKISENNLDSIKKNNLKNNKIFGDYVLYF